MGFHRLRWSRAPSHFLARCEVAPPSAGRRRLGRGAGAVERPHGLFPPRRVSDKRLQRSAFAARHPPSSSQRGRAC